MPQKISQQQQFQQARSQLTPQQIIQQRMANKSDTSLSKQTIQQIRKQIEQQKKKLSANTQAQQQTFQQVRTQLTPQQINQLQKQKQAQTRLCNLLKETTKKQEPQAPHIKIPQIVGQKREKQTIVKKINSILFQQQQTQSQKWKKILPLLQQLYKQDQSVARDFSPSLNALQIPFVLDQAMLQQLKRTLGKQTYDLFQQATKQQKEVSSLELLQVIFLLGLKKDQMTVPDFEVVFGLLQGSQPKDSPMWKFLYDKTYGLFQKKVAKQVLSQQTSPQTRKKFQQQAKKDKQKGVPTELLTVISQLEKGTDIPNNQFENILNLIYILKEEKDARWDALYEKAVAIVLEKAKQQNMDVEFITNVFKHYKNFMYNNEKGSLYFLVTNIVSIINMLNELNLNQISEKIRNNIPKSLTWLLPKQTKSKKTEI